MGTGILGLSRAVCGLFRGAVRGGQTARAAWIAAALLTAFVGERAYAADRLVDGKTRNGCGLEAINRWVAGQSSRSRLAEAEDARLKESFRRQTWSGSCIDGRAHGAGALVDSLVGQDARPVKDGDETTPRAETLEGVLFVKGRPLYAPHRLTSLKVAAYVDEQYIYKPTPTWRLGFAGPVDRLAEFSGTLEDGGILPVGDYSNRARPEAWLYPGVSAHGMTYNYVALRDGGGRPCNGLSRCVAIGSPTQRAVPCASDCSAEWDEWTGPFLEVFIGQLASDMPRFEAAALAGGVDASGVKALIAPFVARSARLQKAQTARALAAADAARRNSVEAATQAGRLFVSPALDRLLSLSPGR